MFGFGLSTVERAESSSKYHFSIDEIEALSPKSTKVMRFITSQSLSFCILIENMLLTFTSYTNRPQTTDQKHLDILFSHVVLWLVIPACTKSGVMAISQFLSLMVATIYLHGAKQSCLVTAEGFMDFTRQFQSFSNRHSESWADETAEFSIAVSFSNFPISSPTESLGFIHVSERRLSTESTCPNAGTVINTVHYMHYKPREVQVERINAIIASA